MITIDHETSSSCPYLGKEACLHLIYHLRYCFQNHKNFSWINLVDVLCLLRLVSVSVFYWMSLYDLGERI